MRASQPVLGLIAIGVLWRLRLLTLDAALAVLVVTMLLQLGWAYFAAAAPGWRAGTRRSNWSSRSRHMARRRSPP